MPCVIAGLTVVGNPVAAVMTSLPGAIRRSRSNGDVRAENATRLAEEPEFTVMAYRAPTRFARLVWNWSLNRPAVSQKSSAESTSDLTSLESKTRPETGTGDVPPMNGFVACARSEYCPTRSMIDALRFSRVLWSGSTGTGADVIGCASGWILAVHCGNDRHPGWPHVSERSRSGRARCLEGCLRAWRPCTS